MSLSTLFHKLNIGVMNDKFEEENYIPDHIYDYICSLTCARTTPQCKVYTTTEEVKYDRSTYEIALNSPNNYEDNYLCLYSLFYTGFDMYSLSNEFSKIKNAEPSFSSFQMGLDEENPDYNALKQKITVLSTTMCQKTLVYCLNFIFYCYKLKCSGILSAIEKKIESGLTRKYFNLLRITKTTTGVVVNIQYDHLGFKYDQNNGFLVFDVIRTYNSRSQAIKKFLEKTYNDKSDNTAIDMRQLFDGVIIALPSMLRDHDNLQKDIDDEIKIKE